MKPSHLLVLSALSVASSSLFAQASVTIYGIVDTAVTSASNGAANFRRVDSGVGPGSRLGFRGAEDLGGGLKANFVLESGVAVDSGLFLPGGLAFGRQSWVGLSSDMWSVSLGRQYSPMDEAIAFSGANYFYYWGSPVTMGFGGDAAPKATPTSGGFQSTDRISNSVLVNGNFGKVKLSAIMAFNDEATNSTGRFYGIGGNYQTGGLRLNFAVNNWRQYASEINAGSSPANENNYFVGGTYDFGPVKANAGYYVFNPSSANKTLTAASNLGTKATWIGLRAPFGSHAVSAQIMQARYARMAGVSEGRANTVGLAYEYLMSKRTTLYVSAGTVNNNSTSAQALVAGASAVAASGNGASVKAVSLGVTHRF